MPEHEAITAVADLHHSLVPLIDTNANELIEGVATTSAVNHLQVTNSATGNSPSLAAIGSDTNLDLLLVAKGSGVVKAGGVEVADISSTQSLSNKTLTAPTISGAITFPDDVKQVFNPGSTNAGINVGSVATDPSSLVNGDIWYSTDSDQLLGRVDGVTVDLGASGGGISYTGSGTANYIPYYDGTGWVDSVINASGSDLVVDSGDIQAASTNGTEFRFGSSNISGMRLNSVTNMGFFVYGVQRLGITNTIATFAVPVNLGSNDLRKTLETPASASASGVATTIQWDANYIYVCTATNTWKRAALSTW